MFGEVTGGHFNPAVTIGVLVAEGRENFGLNAGYAAMIILAQVIGGALGCVSAWLAQVGMTTGDVTILKPGIANLAPVH